MKHFVSFLFLLFFSSLINVEGEENYAFSRIKNKDGEKTLTVESYVGSKDVTELVVPKMFHDSTVTQIKKIIGRTEGYQVQRVFFSAGLTLGTSSTSSTSSFIDQNCLRCGVLDTNVSIKHAPFYYSNASSFFIDCIYSFTIFGQAGIENLIGTNLTNYCLFLGTITINYKGNIEETIEMFNCGGLNVAEAPKLFFDQSRYNHLLWALEQHLVYKDYTMEDIESIDFRGLTNTIKIGGSDKGVTFTVSDYFLDGKLPSGAQVFLPNDETYTNTPTPYTITDLQNFTAPSTSQTISGYSRSNTQQWNSVCLPFDIIESDFPVGTHIYTLNTSTSTAEEIHLSRCTGTVSAGTPCVIYSESADWNLSFETESRTVRTDVVPQTQQSVCWRLCGSFTTTNIGQKHYKLNDEGNAFSVTTSNGKIHPFRCYLQYVGQGSVPTRVRLLIDEN